MTIGNAIKERRKMLKITQRTLAELAGVGIIPSQRLNATKGILRSTCWNGFSTRWGWNCG
mgnify:CR=1 FL=1